MPQIFRYLIVAVIVYVIDMGGYIGFIKVGFTPVFANVLIKLFATGFGFFAHRYFTYQIKDTIGISRHALKYFTTVVLYIPISSVLLYLVLMVLPYPVYAKFGCDMILFVIVYWLTSKFIFLKI